ncbi:hypothetical protein M430DRAFT_245391 [Amorphotheca resinae ATCC 22711]|uniref:Uncharacterized protein n=1 Tax=Amorphotheca resinae ATCC 22711 TaxID=857342 RepID=A0A2T3AZC9_AMORE|nr:hypothetical protein M430DRAFT_245391 [Amorphotheca resinae ATCC 22711]PSS16526.1 hypothetical protein M430DRAFT_245391 [Amorphotheca resinae ATCC 22711]
MDCRAIGSGFEFPSPAGSRRLMIFCPLWMGQRRGRPEKEASGPETKHRPSITNTRRYQAKRLCTVTTSVRICTSACVVLPDSTSSSFRKSHKIIAASASARRSAALTIHHHPWALAIYSCILDPRYSWPMEFPWCPPESLTTEATSEGQTPDLQNLQPTNQKLQLPSLLLLHCHFVPTAPSNFSRSMGSTDNALKRRPSHIASSPTSSGSS